MKLVVLKLFNKKRKKREKIAKNPKKSAVTSLKYRDFSLISQY